MSIFRRLSRIFHHAAREAEDLAIRVARDRQKLEDAVKELCDEITQRSPPPDAKRNNKNVEKR